MDVISLINMKGGSAKSTTTHNLAGALAKLGRRVLAVDNDPQSSLSQGLLGPAVAEALDPAETIAAVYERTATPEAILRGSGVAGVDLLPGSIHTDRHNRPSPEESPWPDQVCLREFLLELEGRYDAVLIDNPPNLHLCGWAALAASTWALIPVVPEDYGSQGLTPVRRSIARVQAAVNPGLRLLGLVLTQVQPRERSPTLRGHAPRDLWRRGPGRPHPRRRRLPRGDRPPAADHPLQAEVRRGERPPWPWPRRSWSGCRDPPRIRTGRPPDVEARRAAEERRPEREGFDRRPPRLPTPAASGPPPRWRGVVRSRDAAAIPLEMIVADPSQPRTEFDEEELPAWPSRSGPWPAPTLPGQVGRRAGGVHDPRRRAADACGPDWPAWRPSSA
jgi:chromosome partitioning protein